MKRAALLLFVAVALARVGAAQVTSIPAASGGGGGGTATPLNVRVVCQNTLAGSAFSEPATNGASHNCDSAWSSMDGYEAFSNGATNYALLGPFNLSSAFTDPLRLTIWFNSSSTSGSFQPSVAALCVASGGSITTNWWAAATYSNFTSTATNGTAGVVTSITPLSYSTGCSTGVLYLAFRATSAATPAAGANIKLLTIAGIQ